ncbi:UDP-N-acetylmuramoyl-L-alanyl-D-glutamate--2,6-diaminopimelate ligase [Luteimonas sp. MJ250]|uniref:UDP-N-acetylmuramoyl-L-alanyl-D-glutamate--2, 6-diaminopimelate ligase n=1 Tax=Luteimonas sp. MJ250 TaxID=3129236 RepID=UPI0031BA4E77
MSRRMALRELLPDVAGIPATLEVSGLVLDSRSLRAGDGFVAIGGFGTHGLHFAGQALADGAAVVMYEPPVPADVPAPPANAIAVPGLRARMGAMADQFHGRPSAAMSTVAVTGTNGKTSTVQLLAQAWELLGRRAATIGTLGAGLHGNVQPTGFTTPLVLQVHELLAGLRDAGAQAVAMETSSHALDQGRVDAVHFEVGVFTNLTRDHLDYHGDMATYGAAKERLFGVAGLSAAVVNIDDGFGRGLFARLPSALRRIGTSARGDAEALVAATDIVLDVAGIAFQLRIDRQLLPVRSPLLGRFNVENLLAVAGVLHAQGVAAADIARVLGRLEPIAGRMNRFGGHGGLPLVVVDYAHTPDALEQALAAVRAHAAGRITCVFGCGGERDRGKRPEMAAAAVAGADFVVVTDDNPRGEDGNAIVVDIMAGIPDTAVVVVERDRAAAITRAIGVAGPGDIVLVAGKGHEPCQEINGVRHPFDDRDVARRALEART